MAKEATTLSLDADVKSQAQKLFADFGLDLSTAVDIFLRHSIRENRIPFDIRQEIPNAETIAAMKEAERIAKDPSVKGYTDLDELFADLEL